MSPGGDVVDGEAEPIDQSDGFAEEKDWEERVAIRSVPVVVVVEPRRFIVR